MSPGHMPCRPTGAVEHGIYSFLISALDGWIFNATPRSLCSRERASVPIVERGQGESKGRSGRVWRRENLLLPPVFEPRPGRASRYTDLVSQTDQSKVQGNKSKTRTFLWGLSSYTSHLKPYFLQPIFLLNSCGLLPLLIIPFQRGFLIKVLGTFLVSYIQIYVKAISACLWRCVFFKDINQTRSRKCFTRRGQVSKSGKKTEQSLRM